MRNKILLSTVFTGRNDSYLGNFKYRLSTAIEMLIASAIEIGRLREIEIIVVDWNSDTPLAEELLLSEEALEVTKFIAVPKETASRYNFDKKPFNAGLSCNVGVKRASGEYISYLPADILINAPSLFNLMRLLGGEWNSVFECQKTMMGVHAQILPWQLVEKEPTAQEWKRYIQLSNNLEFTGYPGLCGCYAALILHRSLWLEYRGIFEGFEGWGWIDIELGLRVNLKYPFIGLIGFGIFFSDMQQAPHKRQGMVSNKGNGVVPQQTVVNNKNWGLAQEKLTIKKGRKISSVEKDGSKVNIEATELSELLRDSKVIDSILRILPHYKKYCRDTSQAILLLLSALSRKLFWQKVIVVGVKDFLPSLYLSRLNPAMELYLIDTFSNGGFDDNSVLLMTLAEGEFKGFLRCLPGPIETSSERLKSEFIGSFNVDLILLDLDLYGDSSFSQITILLEALNEKGLLIYQSCSKTVLKSFVEKNGSILESSLHLFYDDRNVGLILK